MRATLSTAAFSMCSYLCCSLLVTTYSKVVLQQRFPFPLLLTGCHAVTCWAGTWTLAKIGNVFIPARLPWRLNLRVTLFSLLYTLNIIVSNYSLRIVTAALHSIVRSMIPINTILISFLVFGKQASLLVAITMVPMTVGVGLATIGMLIVRY